MTDNIKKEKNSVKKKSLQGGTIGYRIKKSIIYICLTILSSMLVPIPSYDG